MDATEKPFALVPAPQCNSQANTDSGKSSEEELSNHPVDLADESKVPVKQEGVGFVKRSNVSFKLEDLLPESGEELLGSVVTVADDQPLRTSARVIQKMRQDSSTRPGTPPVKEEKNAPKTPTQNQRLTPKILWSNTERGLFFDAVNEYGRDFEGIAQYINQKMKRKVGCETNARTRDQIRQLYMQTFHKVTKYVRFSEGESIICRCFKGNGRQLFYVFLQVGDCI